MRDAHRAKCGGEVPLHYRYHFCDGDRPACHGRQRRDGCVADAARDDPVVPRQVTVTVQRETMHGHAPRDAHPDGGDLAVRAPVAIAWQPGAATSVHPPGRHPELRAVADHRVFQGAYVRHDIDRLAECHYGVARELTGTVPGDVAAAVDVN